MRATTSPPSSAAPNFTNPYSIAKGLNAVGIFCTALTTLTTAIRLYTKLVIMKAHGWEDCRYNSMCYQTFIISDRVNEKADTMFIAWVMRQSLLAASMSSAHPRRPLTDILPGRLCSLYQLMPYKHYQVRGWHPSMGCPSDEDSSLCASE